MYTSPYTFVCTPVPQNAHSDFPEKINAIPQKLQIKIIWKVEDKFKLSHYNPCQRTSQFDDTGVIISSGFLKVDLLSCPLQKALTSTDEY